MPQQGRRNPRRPKDSRRSPLIRDNEPHQLRSLINALMPMRRACLRFAAMLSLISALCSCDDSDTVVLYASADDRLVREVVEAFQEQTGLKVLLVGDTEVKKTTGLIERLRDEKDNPQADVFWSSEIFMTIDLAADDVFEPHESPMTREWPPEHRDPKGLWYAFAARARVIIYAPERVPQEHVPKTWMDLTKSRFRGRIVMAD